MAVQSTHAEWVAPGPGAWELDTAHYEPTVSRIARDVIEHAAPEGLRQGFDLLGAPLATMDSVFVNGRFYRRMTPLVGGDRNLPPPPPWVLRAAFRVVPKLRRRAAVADDVLAGSGWRAEFDRWESEWKPDLVAANRRFGSVDLESLTDGELAAHVDALYAHLLRSCTLHFRLHTSDLGPIGRVIVATADWGVDGAAVMDVLAGASPSTSAPQRALQELRRELRSSGCTPASLDDVRRASPRARELLDAYLAEFGDRLTTGYDLRDSTLAEMPAVVVASLVDERSAGPADAAARGEDALDRLRAEIPPGARDEFDELVADARRTYGLRDENGPLTYEWPAGLLRLAVLAAADRLRSTERLDDREHVFDATAAEIAGMLRGRRDPTAEELADRCAERMSWVDLDAPLTLGPPPPDPPLDALPEAMATMMRISLAVIDLLEAEVSHRGLEGTGIGDTSYTGTARVVADADEALDRAEPGDVIVTKLTVPTFNSVLAMAGGVVTQHGGLLCHTAVIARELGIPAVVGVRDALTAIPDGSEVEVDPVRGVVTVL